MIYNIASLIWLPDWSNDYVLPNHSNQFKYMNKSKKIFNLEHIFAYYRGFWVSMKWYRITNIINVVFLAEISLIFYREILIIGQTSRPQQILTGSKECVQANKLYFGLDMDQGFRSIWYSLICSQVKGVLHNLY